MRTRHSILPSCILALFLLSAQSADAQFLKKLFKKGNKTEKKSKTTKDGINDDLQTVMLDVTAQPDNSNNRNGFLGIAVGVKADRFEQQLLGMGFTERKADGPQTAKSYTYEGNVYDRPAVVTLYISDQTSRVFAVDVEETTVYETETMVQKRFQELKKQLSSVYGKGYVDNGGEGYVIMNRLGGVNLHYERAMIGGSYTLGFTVDDAKAYQMAYQEMSDRDYEAVPRQIEAGLAAVHHHTDLVGLAVKLLQNRTLAKAQTVLRGYDYTVGKPTVKAVTATFAMEDYQSSVSIQRKKQTVTGITMTATDEPSAVIKDLKTYGFTTTDEKTFREGKKTILLSTDAQGRLLLRLK